MGRGKGGRVTIAVVNGMLSMKAEAIAETQRMRRRATVSRDSSLTDLIRLPVFSPIQSISPSSPSAYAAAAAMIETAAQAQAI